MDKNLINKSTIILFKSVLAEESNFVPSEEALKYGVLIPDWVDSDSIDLAIDLYGKDGTKWNQTFHKSFDIVSNSDIETLYVQQLTHYITTYGFEALDIFSHDTVYIPAEKLNIPELGIDKIKLVTITPITESQLKESISTLISGVALSEDTIDLITNLYDFIDTTNIDSIRNTELRTHLYTHFDIVPKNPEDFLRYVIYLWTGPSLKIKSAELIDNIKNISNAVSYCEGEGKPKFLNADGLVHIFERYIHDYDNELVKLGSIFNRNKPLFLAFKGKSAELNKIINRISKSSKINHKPVGVPLLDSLTSNTDVDIDRLQSALDNATTFRLVRILNGLKYRLEGSSDVVYKIRNGKSFADTRKELSYNDGKKLEDIYNIVYKNLIERIRPNIEGLHICIPNGISYTVPQSEKQFIGNIPSGSYVEVPGCIGSFVYGIHWKNMGDRRVDLDLHQYNESTTFGWDGYYRNYDRSILFSGDITDASLPNGATELFKVQSRDGNQAYAVTVNDYTCIDTTNEKLPFEFVVAQTDAMPKPAQDYVIDPNNILLTLRMSFSDNQHQKTIGTIVIQEDNVRLYFADFSSGIDRTVRNDSRYNKIIANYLETYNNVQLNLRDILTDAGAIIHDQPKYAGRVIIQNGTEVPEYEDVDVDLSYETITKESLLNFFK